MIDVSRLLVCGDRNWEIRGPMWDVLDYLRDGHRILIIEGGARGADKGAADWARGNHNLGADLEEYSAHWHRHGKAAGPIRNREMLDEGRPTFVLAFHNDITVSKGTGDMITLAADNGIPYAVLTEEDCRREGAWLR